MPYDLQLVQINNAGVGGLRQTDTAWGFPVSTNFHTLLMSYWMCGPPGVAGISYVGVWPLFGSAGFFTFDTSANHLTFGKLVLGSYVKFYDSGAWALPSPGVRMHFLMSADTHAETVQLYVNDAPVTLAGSWTGTPPFDFNLASTGNIWLWENSGATGTGHFPGMGDAWISNTPAFVDLSVVANRRKFINANLTPVDLGNTGTNPFAYQPALYMSIRPGGVATDILNNLGLGGGSWGLSPSGEPPPTFQDPGACTLPPGSGTSLSLDNLVVTTPSGAAPAGELVFLDWSDDRGHSFGSPVGQLLGPRGDYERSLQWRRLGYARDRVFRLTWSIPTETALQGAWVEAEAGNT